MSAQNQNMTITILICTALVMLAVLTVFDFDRTGPAAYAGSMQDRGGDYSVTVAQLSSGQEALWILDTRHETIGVYLVDNKTKRLELRKVLRLADVRARIR